MAERGLERKDLEEIFTGFEKRQDEKLGALEGRMDEKFQVLEIHPLAKIEEGQIEIQAVVVFVEGPEEFHGNGVGKFHGHHLEPASEGMSRLQGPGYQVQGLGQLLLKFPEAELPL